MYFKFPCPGCGKNLKARDEHIGRRVGCPYCKTAVTVPEPPLPEPPLSEKGAAEPPPINVSARSASGSPPAPAIDTRRGSSPRPGRAASSARRVDGSNVSLLQTGLIGAAMTVLMLALLYPLRSTYVGALFHERGWIPYAETFFMNWSLAILFFKYQKLTRQRRSLLFDLLPTELSEEITLGTLDKFTSHIRSLPGNPGESFLINRVLRGLEHFGVRKNAPEVATILQSQSEIDANTVASSYSMLKVFIWAIPILGFIGTVIGIGEAVGGFAGVMDKADDISVIKESLNNVTGGLSTAFDTTLLALLISMLIKFPVSSMQKDEEDMLSWVDEYCNENLLKRLNDGREGGAERGSGGGRSAIQEAVDAAMKGHHIELQSWSKRLESIGVALSDQVAEGWTRLNEKAGQQWEEAQTRLEAQQAKQQQDAEAIATMATQVRETLLEVDSGLRQLNGVLESLGDRQITVEMLPPPPRRGWWFGRSKAGRDNHRTVKHNGTS